LPQRIRGCLGSLDAGWGSLACDSAISPADWAACMRTPPLIPEGAERVVIGGDLGYTRDCTAFVAAWRTEDRQIMLEEPVILEPPGDGTSIDIDDMLTACHEYAALWPWCVFAFDEQYGGQQLLQRLEKEIPQSEFIAYPQNPTTLCAAAMSFAELVATREARASGRSAAHRSRSRGGGEVCRRAVAVREASRP
jgi:hypothetical protein